MLCWTRKLIQHSFRRTHKLPRHSHPASHHTRCPPWPTLARAVGQRNIIFLFLSRNTLLSSPVNLGRGNLTLKLACISPWLYESEERHRHISEIKKLLLAQTLDLEKVLDKQKCHCPWGITKSLLINCELILLSTGNPLERNRSNSGLPK